MNKDVKISARISQESYDKIKKVAEEKQINLSRAIESLISKNADAIYMDTDAIYIPAKPEIKEAEDGKDKE